MFHNNQINCSRTWVEESEMDFYRNVTQVGHPNVTSQLLNGIWNLRGINHFFTIKFL